MPEHDLAPLILDVSLERKWVRSFDEYPFCIPCVRNLTTLKFHPKVTYFVGENGTGKSTLLEAVAVRLGLNAEGGSRNFSFATRESHSDLHRCLRIARPAVRHVGDDAFFLRAESFYNVASEVDRVFEGDDAARSRSYGNASLHEQSHGEAFFSLLTTRFREYGLYLLDEPESALSPTRQLSMLTLMHDLVRRGSQFIIATHSPIVMAYPDATIYHFTSEGIRTVEYTETEHYKTTRMFLERREAMLRELLKEE